jgi:hypothetical protein
LQLIEQGVGTLKCSGFRQIRKQRDAGEVLARGVAWKALNFDIAKPMRGKKGGVDFLPIIGVKLRSEKDEPDVEKTPVR